MKCLFYNHSHISSQNCVQFKYTMATHGQQLQYWPELIYRLLREKGIDMPKNAIVNKAPGQKLSLIKGEQYLTNLCSGFPSNCINLSLFTNLTIAGVQITSWLCTGCNCKPIDSFIFNVKINLFSTTHYFISE